MLVKIIVLLIIGALVFLFIRRRGRVADSAKGRHNILDDIPNRVLNPVSYKNIPLITAWEFVAPNLSTSCKFARDNAGIRKTAENCTPLPLAECGSEACLCHYRPIFDERRKNRRKDKDRRNDFRMDDKEDRRVKQDRRVDNHSWHDKHIK
jgi:hypothetical protein